MTKPSWVFWKEWKEAGRKLPLVGDCPRCGENMIGGFWMHLCPDNPTLSGLSTKPIKEEFVGVTSISCTHGRKE